MRTPTIDDDPLVDALSEVFARHGYEGANLRLLSEASGLKRASLYHRFPGGKDEILSAVLQRAEKLFKEALAPAHDDGDPHERAVAVADRLNSYYGGGNRSCIIVALSMADEERREAVTPCIDAWIDAFRVIARDAGADEVAAKNVALDAVATLEGALVIAAASGQTHAFERAISALAARLTTP